MGLADTVPESASTSKAEVLPEAAPSLDTEILKVLRADVPSQKAEVHFHPTLVDNWGRIIRDGLKKEDKSEMLTKYPRIGRCRLEAPAINTEVDSILSDKMKKRDRFFTHDQNVCGSSLSALGTAITMILTEDEEVDKLQVLELLNDAGWLLSELFHLLSIARRSFLLSGIDKKMKSLLEKSKADDWLFGAELSQHINSARAAEKVGSTLKFQPVQRTVPVRFPSGNWRGLPARQFPQGRWPAGTSLKWAQRSPARYRTQELRGPRLSTQSQAQYQARPLNFQRSYVRPQK